MFRQDMQEEDLREEVYCLRKNISTICSENHMLKVKIRKLRDEMIQRDKQLDSFLDPRRFLNVSKTLQDKGASMLLNLKLRNEKLEQMILEKDVAIKRLQNTLQTAKLYSQVSQNNNRRSNVKATEYSPFHNRMEYYVPAVRNSSNESLNMLDTLNEIESQFLYHIDLDVKQRNKNQSWVDPKHKSQTMYALDNKTTLTEGTTMDETENFTNSIETQQIALKQHATEKSTQEGNEIKDTVLKPHLRKLLETVENLMGRWPNKKKPTIDQSLQYPLKEPEVSVQTNENCLGDADELTGKLDKENNDEIKEDTVDEKSIKLNEDSKVPEMAKETPHEEIKQLHIYLVDMISQVDQLKDTIVHLKSDQERTDNFLRMKDQNIEKLAKEIKSLKDSRSVPQASNQTPSIDSCYEIFNKTKMSHVQKIPQKTSKTGRSNTSDSTHSARNMYAPARTRRTDREKPRSAVEKMRKNLPERKSQRPSHMMMSPIELLDMRFFKHKITAYGGMCSKGSLKNVCKSNKNEKFNADSEVD